MFLTSGAYIHDFSFLKKACSAYPIKTESMKGLIISLFQPVQRGKASEKMKNKESYYILQPSDTSVKHGL